MTGGASGIGAASARRLARDGLAVVCCDVAETAGTEMEGVQRERLLQEVSSPVFASTRAAVTTVAPPAGTMITPAAAPTSTVKMLSATRPPEEM